MKFAKSVIEVWLWGGASHLETFDPKPAAPADYNNGLKDIATKGRFRLHEWMPKLARCADLFSVVRTLTHPHAGHETATYLMQTGRNPGGGTVFPAVGATIATMKAREYRGDLPPFVILTQAKGRFSEVGFLGEENAPLVTGGNPNAPRFIVDGFVPPGGIDAKALAQRFALADRFGGLPRNDAFEAAGTDARRIITGTAAQTFDLSRETKEMRARYGHTHLGQSLLAARRLVEYGVPYVSVNCPGWDSHKKHFETMNRPVHELDTAIAALLTDLQARRLLETTIVWVCGEFGRTPLISREAPWNGGRGHYPRCFSALLAGGGFKGGVAVGESDALGEKVVSRPVSPVDFLGSICARAGIDPDGPLRNARGLKHPVLPPPSEAGRLEELYA